MDGAGGLAMLRVIAPHIPGLSYAALQHTLGSTPTSSYWDLRTEMTVGLLRRMTIAKPGKVPAVGKVQALTLKDPGVKGKIWVAKASFAAPPEDDARQAVFKAVQDMKVDGEAPLVYTQPEAIDVPFEWTGYRPGASAEEPLPANLSEEERYKRMMAEPTRTSNATLLYFHGGAYYLCSPATHRNMCQRLAQESKGRVVSVAYRLAPQTAFPGQLLDAFVSYLGLLYPPPGSFHEAVPAEHIVLGGDSAGGNLCFALLQFLLQLHRSSDGVPVVKFHGRDVHVPLPAGASANSGWFDVTRSLPSILGNADFDYLPKPRGDDAVSEFPKDDIWPTNPPRGDLFCELALLDHPLVSPVAAADWAQSPPLWICVGREMLTDEVVAVASRAATQGVKVQFEQYEAMPHCFQLLMPWRANSDRCLKSYGDFVRRCVEEPATLKTRGTEIKAKSGKESEVDVAAMESLGLEEIRKIMAEMKERRVKGWDKEGKGLPKPAI